MRYRGIDCIKLVSLAVPPPCSTIEAADYKAEGKLWEYLPCFRIFIVFSEYFA